MDNTSGWPIKPNKSPNMYVKHEQYTLRIFVSQWSMGTDVEDTSNLFNQSSDW